MTTITPAIREKITELCSHGLTSGVGRPEPGQMCGEAVVSFALGEPHGDKPSCVSPVDRAFFVRLNDADWPSNEARAAALLPLLQAQLGTAGEGRRAWAAAVVEGTVRRVVPIALRAAAAAHPVEFHRDALRAAAARCEDEGSHAAAADAADAGAGAGFAANAAAAAARFAANAAAYAAAYAADAAVAAAVVAAKDIAGVTALRASVQVALDAYAAEGRHERTES